MPGLLCTIGSKGILLNIYRVFVVRPVARDGSGRRKSRREDYLDLILLAM